MPQDCREARPTFRFLLVAGALGAVGVAAGTAAPSLLWPATAGLVVTQTGDDPLLCAISQRDAVRLTNTSSFRRVRVSAVASSCGCAEITEFPRSIRASDCAEVSLVVSPGPFEREVRVTLSVVGDGGQRAFSYVREVVLPFEGWPQHASADRVGSTIQLKVDPHYRAFVEKAILFGSDDQQLEMPFDAERSVVWAEAPSWALEIDELAFVFKSGQPWAGPTTMPGDPSSNQ